MIIRGVVISPTNISVSGSSWVIPWKCGRAEGLMLFVLVSPSASLTGKALWIPAMVKIGEAGPSVETRYYSSSDPQNIQKDLLEGVHSHCH